MLVAAFIFAPGVTATESAVAPTSKVTFNLIKKTEIPVPIVTFPAIDVIPVAEQDELYTVTVARPALKAKVFVNWGDGTEPSTARNACNLKFTLKMGPKCVMSFPHYFNNPGVYNMTVTQAGRTLGVKQVTVKAIPVAWSAPEGWVQPANWAVFNRGATFLPCSTVNWFFDRNNEPADRTRMVNSIQPSLNLLQAETGLTFVQTADRANARLIFDWPQDIKDGWGGASAVGGGRGFNSQAGYVSFNPTNWWTEDKWAGFGILTQDDGWYGNGNGWLIIHEVMHTLGMGHVSDVSQVMNPVSSATQFGQGDLDGLHTMYRNQPCPT